MISCICIFSIPCVEPVNCLIANKINLFLMTSACLLNSFKYIWRTYNKNGREDIEKAKWYLDKYLELTKDL